MPSNKPKKIRIDQLLVDKGLAPSRTRAQALVLAGQVLVEEHRVEKSSQSFFPEAHIRLKGQDHPFVGRGGVKLSDALDKFGVVIEDKICLDIGASTGGFTDCLLQNAAKRVYAFDSGTLQLHERLRRDERVIFRENFNVRFLQASDLPEAIDLIVVDVSFISLKLIIPPLLQSVRGSWELLALIKPQFEAQRGQVGRGGIIKDELLQQQIVSGLVQFFQDCPLEVVGTIPSVIKGEGGNQEYFIHARKPL